MAWRNRPSGATRSYEIWRRTWPRVAKRAIGVLMPLELIGLVPILVIFGLAQPDLYRTKMWQIGFDNKLNSNPNMILYAYLNSQPLPKVPFIWTKTLTNFNVAISIISLFFLFAKLIAYIMKVWFPILATGINASLVALYAVSVYGQIGPDHADPRYPAPAAWYFRFGCDLARPSGDYSSCQMAQGSLAVTLYLLVVYLINLGFCLYAMWPNALNNRLRDDEDDDDDSNASDRGAKYTAQGGLMSPMSLREMPFTPRTQAFHTLDRKLPQQSATRYN